MTNHVGEYSDGHGWDEDKLISMSIEIYANPDPNEFAKSFHKLMKRVEQGILISYSQLGYDQKSDSS